jgi:hypothetical protein
MRWYFAARLIKTTLKSRKKDGKAKGKAIYKSQSG